MDKLNGPMVGYKIFYQAQGGQKKHISVGNVPSVTLTNLQKYTLYTISASVRNSMYEGPASGDQQQKTLEDGKNGEKIAITSALCSVQFGLP